MSGVEKPIYLIAFFDQWLTDKDTSMGAVTAWGSEEQALWVAREEARKRNVPPALYRIVEFQATGNVIEA